MHTLRSGSERALVRLNRNALLFVIMSGVIFLFSGGSSALSSAGNTVTQAFWLVTFLNAVLLVARTGYRSRRYGKSRVGCCR
jgi:hypothetical protein